MKIALFALSIACLCFCGCSENHNDQQQFDPLTAPIQEVQALQQKIVVKIKDAEALNDEKIKVNNAKIADATIRGANDEVHAYLILLQRMSRLLTQKNWPPKRMIKWQTN
jgi:hypothetical protein